MILGLWGTALGCGRLQVTRINSSEQKPNNVWIFFTVEKGDEPVGGLSAQQFEIYEDERLVSEFESKQTIQNPDVAAVMYTMLLLDMSGSVTESGQADSLVDAARLFSDRVGKSQKVGVYAFDGAEKIHSVVPFTEAQGSVEGGLEGLRSYHAKDPSTNLYGAIINGIKELKEALDKDPKPLKFGTLVVFSDGTDRAARFTRDEMREELAKEEYRHYEVFAIGVGAEMSQGELQDIGRDGTELAADRAKIQESFEKVAQRIESHMKRFYLLSYCTPSRERVHTVRIKAVVKEEENEKLHGTGSLEYQFDATGFGPPPECNPERPPNFRLDDVEIPSDEEEPQKSTQSVNRSSKKSLNK
jgi:hypothetical protein